MGMIVCHDCEREIGESAPVCPHCGAAQTAETRQYGARRRQQIIIHGSTAVLLGALGAIVAGLVSSWVNASDDAIGIAVIASGLAGFVVGSILGYWMAERFTKSRQVAEPNAPADGGRDPASS